MNELSRRMMVTGGNVTGITDQLVAEGLVDRVDVAGDRRAYRVRLTPKGRKLFNEMAHQHESWIVDAFAGLSDKDIATLHKLLGKVKDHAQPARRRGGVTRRRSPRHVQPSKTASSMTACRRARSGRNCAMTGPNCSSRTS